MVGRVDMLEPRDAIEHWKAKGLDLTPILHKPDVSPDVPIHCVEAQDHGLDEALDNQLIELARPALERREPVEDRAPDP